LAPDPCPPSERRQDIRQRLLRAAPHLHQARAVRQPGHQGGGDGFIITPGDVSRRSVAAIADGLVPALQARGLARRAYGHAQLRDNLLEF